VRYSGLGAHYDIVSDFNVIHDPDLPGQDDVAPDPGRTRNSDLGDNDRIFPMMTL
jgi:hypothetical protein